MKKMSNVNLVVSIFKEGKHYVAYSPSLDLATHGSTIQEARKMFDEIVQIFFDDLQEQGSTEEVLTGLGWQKVNRHLQPPKEVEHRVESYRVPALV